MKTSKTSYLLAFILAFSISGYLNVAQGESINIFQALFLPDSLYHLLCGVVISTPMFFMIEMNKNGMKGVDGKTILLKGLLVGFCFFGSIAGMNNVNSIYGDAGVLYMFGIFLFAFAQILWDKLKELKNVE